MATLTITVPDEQVPRVMDALAAKHEYDPLSGITKAEFVRRLIITYLKNEVKRFERLDHEDTFTFDDPGLS